MKLEILTYPNPILREVSEPVKEFGPELKKLAEDMLETMYDAPGVGLAANQVGVLQRMIVLDVDYDVEGEDEASRRFVNQNPLVVINPELIKKAKKTILFKEGCLSVPGVNEEVQRSETVTLRYQDLEGSHHEIDATGLLAICVQHEIDHLDGKLFIDRLSVAKRGLIKSKIKNERGKDFERSKFHVEL